MPPVNDNVADAIELTFVGPSYDTISDDNTTATSESAYETSWWGEAVHSMWYYYHNDTASSITFWVLSVNGSSGFNVANGAEIDSWLINGTPTDFEDLDTTGTYATWVTPTFGGHSHPAPRDIIIPAGHKLYFSIANWDYFEAGYDTFSITWSIATVPDNDNFVDATLLEAGTHTITGSTGLSTGESPFFGEDVWYLLTTPENPNGGTFELTGTASDGSNAIDIKTGFSIDTLRNVVSDSGSSWSISPQFVMGPAIYIRVDGAGTFSFTYTFTPFAAPLTPVNASAGDEMKSPSAPARRYPGGAVAIRVGDFADGASVGTDPDTPNNNYIYDSQYTSVTYANIFTATHANGAADSLVLDPADIPLETGIYYDVWALVRVLGPSDNAFGKNYERFESSAIAQIWHRQDYEGGSFHQSNDNMPAFNSRWTYRNIGGLSIYGDSGDIFRMRMLIVDTGLEVQVAQLVFLPGGPVNNQSPYYDVSQSFERFDNPSNAASLFWVEDSPYDGITISDARSDKLGSVSVDEEHTSGLDDYMFVRDYQNSDDPDDVEMSTFLQYPVNTYVIDNNAYMYHLFGAYWTHNATVEDDTFSRSVSYEYGSIYPGGGDTNTFASLGRSPYGYVWGTYYTGLGGYWDLNGTYSAETPSKQGVDGSSAIFTLGGTNTQVSLMAAFLGSNRDSSGAIFTTETAPTAKTNDGIIEGVVSWDNPIDGTDPDGGDVAFIGFCAPATNNSVLITNIRLVLNQQPDGSLWASLKAHRDSPQWAVSFNDYDITSPVEFDTAYTPGDKIHLKIRRRRYLLDAKVWYDGDTEPSTWDISGYVPGTQVSSGTRKPLAYPYDSFLSGYSLNSTGFQDSLNNTPYFGNACSPEQAVPVDNGGQHAAITFSWDSVKVTTDPDTDIDTNVNLKITNDAQDEVWVSPQSYPAAREVWIYGGYRTWGVTDGGSDEGYRGFTTYGWVDDDSGKLVAAGIGYYWYRYPWFAEGVEVIPVIPVGDINLSRIRFRNYSYRAGFHELYEVIVAPAIASVGSVFIPQAAFPTESEAMAVANAPTVSILNNYTSIFSVAAQAYTNSSSDDHYVNTWFPPAAEQGILYTAHAGSAFSQSDLYTIDLTNGALNSVGPIGYAVTGMAFHPTTGVLYGVTSGQSVSPRRLITIDRFTGAGTIVGSLGTNMADISFREDGTLWGVSGNSNNLFTINLITGVATSVGNAGHGSAAGGGLDFKRGTNTLYGFHDGDDANIVTYNLTTGFGTNGASLSGAYYDDGGAGFFGGTIVAASFSPGNVLYGLDGYFGDEKVVLSSIDPVTGVFTNYGGIGGIDKYLDALAWWPGLTTAAIATASVVAPDVQGGIRIITSPVASATATTIVPRVDNGTDLSLPYVEDDPLWAGNLEGQSYDDVMLSYQAVVRFDRAIISVIAGATASVTIPVLTSATIVSPIATATASVINPGIDTGSDGIIGEGAIGE